MAGQFGNWAPIAVEKTAGGYEVAWKSTSGPDQYRIWNTDSNGNLISNPIGTVSGSNNALESLEASFQQDLNGDGTIGVPAPSPAMVEAVGSTSLVEIGSSFYLYTGGSGPSLKYAGADVAAGQFGAWSLIGAEQMAGGYAVAWKADGADQYRFWYADSSGNFVTNPFGTVSGTSAELQSLEAGFHQDLNGDGVIFLSGSGSVVDAGTLLVGDGASVELIRAYSGTITFAGATGTLKIDHSASFNGTISGQLAIGDVIDLADITAGAGADVRLFGQQLARHADCKRRNPHGEHCSSRKLHAGELHRLERWPGRDIGRRPADSERSSRIPR